MAELSPKTPFSAIKTPPAATARETVAGKPVSAIAADDDNAANQLQ